ncbi:MAG TPA: integrase [Betaproteobacteria bacterium]|nr:integrase [Betaproteobacteria bacterium]
MSESIVTEFKFTKARLELLIPTDKNYRVRDTGLNGLVCRVFPSGAKSLEIYKKAKGFSSPITVRLCAAGELPIEDVYALASDVLAQMRKGINPNEEQKAKAKERQAKELTLSQALEDYITGDEDLKVSTAKQYRQTINNHLSDWLDKPLAELMNMQTLISLQKGIGKSAGPSAANNTMRTLRAVTTVAREVTTNKDGSLIPYWPIESKQLKKRFWNKENRRDNWIKPHQLMHWWTATEKLSLEYRGNGGLSRDYLQFVLLTGLRRREASGLLWENVRLKSKTFKVTDTKNSTDLELPLSDYLVEILQRRPAREGKVFDLEEPKKFVKWVREQSGVHFTVHDLRRSFITYAEKQDLGAYTLKALINHSTKSRDVTEGYIQIDTERLREPMQRITDYVLGHAKKTSPNKLIHFGSNHG